MSTDANTDANTDTDTALEGVVNSICYNYLEKNLKWGADEYYVIQAVWANPSQSSVSLTIQFKGIASTTTLVVARADYDVDYE